LLAPDNLNLCAALVRREVRQGRFRAAWRHILLAARHDAK